MQQFLTNQDDQEEINYRDIRQLHSTRINHAQDHTSDTSPANNRRITSFVLKWKSNAKRNANQLKCKQLRVEGTHDQWSAWFFLQICIPQLCIFFFKIFVFFSCGVEFLLLFLVVCGSFPVGCLRYVFFNHLKNDYFMAFGLPSQAAEKSYH